VETTEEIIRKALVSSIEQSRVRRIKNYFARFDRFYFSPLFIKDNERIERRG